MNKKNIACAFVCAALATSVSAFDASACRVPERFRNHPLFTTRHCSVNFGFMARRGYFSRPEVFAQAAKIKAAGANWVTLNTHFCQEKFCSTKTFLDFDWSSGEVELEAMIKELHRQGLHILLKPCITTLDSSWMGQIRFPETWEEQIQGVRNTYWTDWFKSLRECLAYYAGIAERNGVEAMIIGAEYHGTMRQNDEWRKTIAFVRERFSGPLTYEFSDYQVANDDFTSVSPKKVREAAWLNDLDFLGISTYPPAAPACERSEWKKLAPIPLETMKKHLAHRRKFLADVSKAFNNMPVVFTEIGTRSCRGNATEPWNYMTESFWDDEEQANFMEAVFSTFSDLPFWVGLSWWKWDESQKNRPHYNVDPLKDRGFTIQGKRACSVLKRWADKGL